MIALVYTIAPVTAALLGGAFTAYRPPSKRLRSIVQHLAAGLVFSAAAVEILPDVIRADALLATAVGSALGIAAMVSMQVMERRLEGPIGLSVASGADVFIDGFVLGLSFLQGAKQGLLLTIALTLELLFLGLSVAATFGRGSKIKTISVTGAIAIALPIGTAMGLMLGGLPEPVLSGLYAFGLIALLYLVTEELLTEAHEVEDRPLMPIAFFLGFLSLMYLHELM
ncbi:MAG: transporter [Xanthobacteraceae bacterium]